MTTREKTSKLLAEFKGKLKRIYGDRLKGVFLYGSQARDEATSQSDVAIIVVLDDWNRYLLELKRTGAIASELSLASGMSISRVFVRERDWLAKATPFLANARAEAVPA
jgi:type I restriction enzyme S subunit